MAIEVVIDATKFTALPDVLKNEYKIQADGTYKLDLGALYVTDKDPAGLMSALEKERAENKRVKEIADKLEAEKKQAELAKTTDIEQMRKMFTEEVEKQKQLFEQERKAALEQVQKQQQNVAEQLRKQKALEIASELFGTRAPIMLPHIEAQLKAVPGDTPSVQVVDSAGNPVLDQDLGNFKKSFSTNPLFKDMIVASKASGGSANDGTFKGATTNSDGSPKTFKDYNSGELMRLKQADPETFKRVMESRT